jgi:hypothetical protein
LKHRFECTGAAKAIDAAAAQYACRRGTNQADNRTLPLARRDESTLRPPTVFMRARNPCARARRIFEGWNVRFMSLCLLREARRGSLIDRLVPGDCDWLPPLDCTAEKPYIRAR